MIEYKKVELMAEEKDEVDIHLLEDKYGQILNVLVNGHIILIITGIKQQVEWADLTKPI